MVTALAPARPASAGAADRAAAIHWETSQFAGGITTAALTPVVPNEAPPTLDELLDEARATYHVVSPRAAYQLVLYGRAVLVDIRPVAQREAEGEIDPALSPVLVDRNVLEWRLDPRSDVRLPWVTDGAHVIVLCQQGYASSLAAATLVRLGVHATDVRGGFAAWRAAGLPVAS